MRECTYINACTSQRTFVNATTNPVFQLRQALICSGEFPVCACSPFIVQNALLIMPKEDRTLFWSIGHLAYVGLGTPQMVPSAQLHCR